MFDFSPKLSIDCTNCQCNAHQFEFAEEVAQGFCNEKHKRGSCFGVILYPIKNPTKSAHEQFCRNVEFNAHKKVSD